MSKIIQTEVFLFHELSEQAQEKALQLVCNINVGYDWWESVYENVSRIGCKIFEFDIDRRNSIDFRAQDSCLDIAKAIKKEHGECCDTYKLATQYLIDHASISVKLLSIDLDCDIEDLNKEFIRALGEEYLFMLKKEYEYLTSEEAIKETINANEYYFTIEGKLT